MKKLIAPMITAASVCGCGINIQAPIHPTAKEINTASAVKRSSELETYIEQDWRIKRFASASLAADTGDKSQRGKLDDLSPQHLEDVYHQRLGLLEKLQTLDESELSADDKINKRILEYQLQNSVDLYRFHDHYQPVTAQSGFHAHIASIADGRFNSERDYRDYLSQLEQLPTYFKQQTYWLRRGIKAGITPPKVTLKGFERSISAFIVPVEQSGYFAPFKNMPAHFSAELKTELKKQGRRSVKQNVLPSYQEFYDFMTGEYIPNARTGIAAASLPDGDAFYENRVQFYTTLPMTADQVHKLGLREVARIKTEMRDVIKQTRFKGGFADFLHFLRTDPRFYPKTAEELLKEASYIAKQADAVLPEYFGKLPRMPYGIEPVPAQIAAKYTTGRYSGSNRDDKAGYYWVNTHALDKRPLYELTALTLHEAVPGHHLQISLNKELDNLPNFRRYSYISAFGEGWGLYAEYLGLEAGLYKDPYSNFGRLSYEMWRAARLVVDTGIHAKGWIRRRAIDYMAENSALSLHNITTEVDRYISWPGQALSYKIGELTIKRLRRKARRALDEKFDIRAFHDAVLANGSVPMSILERQINTFIEQQLLNNNRDKR